MDVPGWVWGLTIVGIVGLLAFDFLFHVRQAHVPTLKEAAIWSAAYIGIAVLLRVGRELGSASAVADSKQTLLCTYLSGVLLVGLLLNSLFGWSWADPIVALVIAAGAVREGRESWRGQHCC